VPEVETVFDVVDVRALRLEEMSARGGLNAKNRCRRLGKVLARLMYCSVAAMIVLI